MATRTTHFKWMAFHTKPGACTLIARSNDFCKPRILFNLFKQRSKQENTDSNDSAHCDFGTLQFWSITVVSIVVFHFGPYY